MSSLYGTVEIYLHRLAATQHKQKPNRNASTAYSSAPRFFFFFFFLDLLSHNLFKLLHTKYRYTFLLFSIYLKGISVLCLTLVPASQRKRRPYGTTGEKACNRYF